MSRQSSVQRWCSLVLLAVLISLSMFYILPVMAFRLARAWGAGRHAAHVDQAYVDAARTQQEQADTARRLSERVRSAVVRVEALVRGEGAAGTAPANPAADDTDPDAESVWSCGLIIDAEGRVLTNFDPVAGARSFRIHFADGQGPYSARFVGGDVDTNLAVLRIDPPLADLPVGELRDCNLPGVGDQVVVVGNARDPVQKLCIGTVSCGGRKASASCCSPQDFIQTAAANSWNQGAPLLNLRGEIVAIASLWGDGSGGLHGMAVPSSVALQVVKQLREYGRVRRGWLGAFLHSIRSLPDHECPTGGCGIVLDYVIPQSPAEKAGLDAGDLLLRVGDRAIQDLSDLRRRIAICQPDAELKLTLRRGSESVERRVRVECRPEAVAHLPGEVEWGLRLVCHLASDERRRYGIEVDDGVVIQTVQPDGAARELQARDVILAVNDVPTQTLAEFCHEVRAWSETDPRPAVRLTVHSAGGPKTVVIEP